MNAPKQQLRWTNFLKDFSQTNRGRPVRLGTFERLSGITNDYWLVDGQPLLGLDLEMRETDAVVEVVLDGFTHVARDVKSLRAVTSIDGSEDGLDLVGTGETTILRFEDQLEWKTRAQ